MAITRRQVLGGMAAGAGLAMAPLGNALAQASSIRHFWWGNPARDKRTFDFIALFQKSHPTITVSGESIGWGDYWTKMATQAAGGNMADVVQMDHGYIHEYVSRQALQPLDPHIGKGLKLDHYDERANAVSTIDGKVYGVNIGSTSQAIPYNMRVFEEAGIAFDPLAWTTEDFKKVCATITETSKGQVRGSEDLSLYIENFEVWVRAAGHDLYQEDGTLGLTAEDIRSYWQFWSELRDAGVVEDKNATVVLDKGMNDLGIVKGTAAMTFRYANQIPAVQSLIKDPVGAAMVPQRPGLGFGHFVMPSMFLSLSRDVKNPDAAIAYINSWITDPEAIRILGVDRGIPPSATGRDALAPVLSDVEKNVVSYFAGIQGKIGPTPKPKPKGAGEVRDSFMRTGTEVVLGNLSADDAAGQFVQDAEDILARAQR
ncbi:ABC transporter substrate-binding protein [Rhizobium sp. SSA_523]|uniref:ABC transporter substrate-binding protein n=1 Tax=Rhizobium sp. SSA_523 TaxID=2952477 RepID=UPI0020909CF4|nr:extracellular solute-binding protein [Rhizobium sp. SSA_523]MCO5732511.1 extracellular solute-binding protein [Rhizobium sp. SSA_523]WKC22349.1 extracellular solute-binding protein [Rhizobium sp. SSA_523]